MRLAIAEPDPVTADVLAFAAQKRGHQTVRVATLSGLVGRLPFEPSAAIASVRGADEATVDQIARVREEYPHLFLMLALERPREPEPMRLLQAGASEVVRSPYNPYELMLKAETALASRGRSAVDDAVRLGDIEIALERYAASKNGINLNLTKLELRLLYCLCEHYPHLAPLDRLLVFGWDTMDDPDAALIKTHISHIRKKLQEAGGIPVEIHSRQTLGYVLSLVTQG
jgi:DNA-binding response OmpR family regulator